MSVRRRALSQSDLMTGGFVTANFQMFGWRWFQRFRSCYPARGFEMRLRNITERGFVSAKTSWLAQRGTLRADCGVTKQQLLGMQSQATVSDGRSATFSRTNVSRAMED